MKVCSVMSDSLQPHGLLPARLLCPWDFPGQESWIGLPCPPPGNLPNPGIKTGVRGTKVDGGFKEGDVFLPGKPHGKRSLVGYSPGGCKESDMTE